MPGKSHSVLQRIKEDKVEFVDLQIIDLIGKINHVTIPSYNITEESLTHGLPKLDGSSLRGFKEIYESDMVIMPDQSTYAMLPWQTSHGYRTARILSFVMEAGGEKHFKHDPRFIAYSAEAYLKEQWNGKSYWGPELEFFVFDKVEWNTNLNQRETSAFYKIYSSEAENPNQYSIRPKEGYYPAEPHDTLNLLRSEMSRVMHDNFYTEVEAHHHEVAGEGQCEINIKYDTLLSQADKLASLKYTVKNVAANAGKVATLMPKPVFGDNGSGLHVHVSLWRDQVNTFYDRNDKYAELSQTGRYFVGGLKEHSRSLAAIVAPTTNSYKRLVPGYEAPIFIAWSKGNRSANVRVPAYFNGKASEKRVEFRTPDPSCNQYLTFPAMLLAGLDGIKKKIEPGDPVDENIYKLTPEKRRAYGVKELPRNLIEAVDSLNSDNAYLKPLFDSALIDWIADYGKAQYSQVESRPAPHEFYLYFDL
jgi:glutamine synthetase